MAFRVETTLKAKRDLDLILAWLLTQHAGESGLSWLHGLREAIASLSELPQRCPLAPENAEKPGNLSGSQRQSCAPCQIYRISTISSVLRYTTT